MATRPSQGIGPPHLGGHRCPHCNFENVPGLANCQVCGTPLEGLTCSRCGFKNPPGYRFCGECGTRLSGTSSQPIAEATRPRAGATAPARPPAKQSKEFSPIALIGFGAVLALASVAYPWYLFGSSGAAESNFQSLSSLLGRGWRWFPGIPLALVTLAAVLSTLVAVFPTSHRVRSIVSLGAGLLTLVCAAWLWLGYSRPQPGAVQPSVVPNTEAILAIIGAIVLLATGLWMLQTLRNRERPH